MDDDTADPVHIEQCPACEGNLNVLAGGWQYSADEGRYYHTACAPPQPERGTLTLDASEQERVEAEAAAASEQARRRWGQARVISGGG